MEVGVRELRDNLSRYLSAVRDGAEVTVTDHGRAVARLVALDEPRRIDRLIDEGLVTPRDGLTRVWPATGLTSGSVSDLVTEQRQ